MNARARAIRQWAGLGLIVVACIMGGLAPSTGGGNLVIVGSVPVIVAGAAMLFWPGRRRQV